jgi:hypothetical protein
MQIEAYCVRQTAKSGPQPPALAEHLQSRAPLQRAIVVADLVARGDQIAARKADHHQVVQLAGDDSRVDFVEGAHPFGDGARAYERQSLHGATEHLEIDVAHRLCDGDAFAGLSMCAVGIAVLEERQRAFAQLEPGALRARGSFSSRRLARCSQPLATAFSPRKAQ